ncbi:hypothetical protein K3495_g12493 [Podosphaera aphanis]|nr:hypothetical protein K3495_g12493 [Podosphaera aphanis]
MYLPRSLISKLYQHLQRTHHPLSPPIIILVGLEPDALCGCRILTQLLRTDYIPHKIKPIAGYGDLQKTGEDTIRPMMESQGGSGGVVICLGVGGLIDLGSLLGIDVEGEEENFGAVEVWVIDARRPWNLANVFGSSPTQSRLQVDSITVNQDRHGLDGGKILRGYKPGKGGIIVFDDGDIEELEAEREAYLALIDMPEIDDETYSSDEGTEKDNEEDKNQTQEPRAGQKRKSYSDEDENDDSERDARPRQKRRNNSSSPKLGSPNRSSQRDPFLDDISALRRSPSGSPSPAQPPTRPSAKTLRRRLHKLRQKYETVLQKYYSIGSSYSEPVSSMMYSLASELGREDNNLLWMTIVGVTSMEIYGRSSIGVAITSESSTSKGWIGTRGSRIRQLLRDEVRRLNPPELADSSTSSNRNALPENKGFIPTSARNPTDTSIRLSPEPKLLLIRHWSLYDSMLHSPYISARLHIWSESGRQRLVRLLAKMGISLVQSKQNYTHMDIELKRGLRNKLLKYSDIYGLDDLVAAEETDVNGKNGTKEGWGFVRSWGWRATLSAHDVGVVIGAILEIGKKAPTSFENGTSKKRPENNTIFDEDGTLEGEEWVERFWHAYDALEKIEELKAAVPTAQFLYRAILRTGTTLIEKRQIRYLRASRMCMCIVKDGPDVTFFTHPAALTKLALWLGEAIAQQEKETEGKLSFGGRGTPLVVASLNQSRGVYTVVGIGGGGGVSIGLKDRQQAASEKNAKSKEKAQAKEIKRKNKEIIREQKKEARRLALGDDSDGEDPTESESSDSSEDDESEEDDDRSLVKGFGFNKFGNAFQEVVEETNVRIRIDSFDHCVVEVKKEDLADFLESLSMKTVVH